MRRQSNVDGRLFDSDQAKLLASVFKYDDGTFAAPSRTVQPFGEVTDLFLGDGGTYVFLSRETNEARAASSEDAKAAFSVGIQHVSWQEAFPEDGILPIA